MYPTSRNMPGINSDYICIAGKNLCSIEFLKFLLKKIPKNRILVCPNNNDTGKNSWQPSIKKFAKSRNIKILKLEDLYKIKNLIFISIEYEHLIKVELFKTKKLLNFHFSLLPKFRGCHTNFYQVYFGEKYSGVTLHKINNGIDTGPIASKIKFKTNFKDTAKENYFKLMKYSIILFKREFKNIINNNLKFYKQKLKRGHYFSRKSINYDSIKIINLKKHTLKNYHKIRSLIFPPFQYPIVNGKIVKKVKYYRKKIILN